VEETGIPGEKNVRENRRGNPDIYRPATGHMETLSQVVFSANRNRLGRDIFANKQSLLWKKCVPQA
jgi:hypothetical protein